MHDALRSGRRPVGDSGDREALEMYQLAYDAECGTSLTADWNALLLRPSVAVLEADGRVVAAVRRTADTINHATVANIWTDPACRGQGLAARLMAFLVDAILAERPAIHLLVDEFNRAAIALYSSPGFRRSDELPSRTWRRCKGGRGAGACDGESPRGSDGWGSRWRNFLKGWRAD